MPQMKTESILQAAGAACQQQACSPSLFISEVLRKDEAAVDELKTLLPEYTPPDEYANLHARGKEALTTLDEMTSLLRSAICICERQGAQTNWEGFAASIRKLGLSGVTARTYSEQRKFAFPLATTINKV